MFKVNTVYRIEPTETKRVICYGFTYIVPKEVSYVAVDEYGTIMGYDTEPMINGDSNYWTSYGETFKMGAVHFEGNWYESLIEV